MNIVELVNKNNGIRVPMNNDTLSKIALINYFDGSLPTDINLGSFNQSAVDTNLVTSNSNIVSRDDSGNIISYAEQSRNKNKHLNLIQISRRFETRTLKYALDYQFIEFFSDETIRDEQYRIITDLKAQVDKLIGDLNAKNNEIGGLKNTDAAKSKQLKDAQDTISKLTKQATDIADNLAKQMQEQSKASTDALKGLTEGIKGEIDKLKKEMDDTKKKADEKSALDKLNDAKNKTALELANKSITQNQSGVNDVFQIGTLADLGFTLPTPAEKEKTNTGTQITINKDPKLFGNTVSIALDRFQTRVNDDRKNAPVIAKPTTTDDRNKRVLNSTNDLLIEIAIGEWYKYHKQEVSMTEGVFKRRETSHRGRLQNDNIDKVTGQMTGAIINKLTNADITYLLEKASAYWKEVPYTPVYSQGIPYTDAEQADFEKIYPGFKGQRQVKTSPPHFLYALNIFDIPLVRSAKNNYVKI